MEQRPKVGVAIIIIKDGKVLLGKRKGSHGEGTWAFPGGHLEFGESVEECAARELMEESGLRAGKMRLGPFTNDIFEKEGRHYITLYVIADHENGEARIMEPEKLEKWGWFGWENLPEPLFIPLKNLVKSGFSPFE